MKIKTLDTSTEEKFCKAFSIKTYNYGNTIKEIHKHSFYQITLLKKGSMRQFTDFEWEKAEAPFISVIFPNQIHLINLSEDAEADVIFFDKSIFNSNLLANELNQYNIRMQKRLNTISHIPDDEWKQIYSYVESMKAISEKLDDMDGNKAIINRLEIKLMVKLIILKTLDIAPMAFPINEIDKNLKYYQKFIDMLTHEFIAQRKVQDYAKALGLNTKRLLIICKKYSGHTPLELIHERLVIELKKMIIDDNIMMKDIAKRLDFSSQPALNKFIERYFETTPQKWKEALENEMKLNTR